jgi:hypothetical protein
MNRLRTFLLFLTLLTALGFGTAYGQEVHRLFENTVSISEDIPDDAFVVANEVSLSGTFADDVWAAGKNVRFDGGAHDDLRLASMEILTINGPVKGDLQAVTASGNMLLNTNTVVGASTWLRGPKQITVHGVYEGDVHIAAAKIVLGATFKGNVTLDSPEIRMLSGTHIEGDLTTVGEEIFPLPADVTLVGTQRQVPRTTNEVDTLLTQLRWNLLAAQFISSFLVGLLMIRLMPRYMGQSVDILLQFRGPCFTTGSLTLAIGAFVGYILVFTLYASGLGIFMLSVTGVFFYLGKIVVALAIGAKLLQTRNAFTFKRLMLALLLGLSLLYLLFSIALIGFTLYILISCWGMGALIIAIRSSQRVIQADIPPHLQKSNPAPEEESS